MIFIEFSKKITNDSKKVKEHLEEDEKALVIKDITKRVIFGCQCLVNLRSLDGSQWLSPAREGISYSNIGDYIERFSKGEIRIVPYLRPMEKMTKEERAELCRLIQENYKEPYGEVKLSGADNILLSVALSVEVVSDFLDSRQFDWRGLIPKGLAVKMTNKTYNCKKGYFKTYYAVGKI